ncbi:MAG TPA: cob(I)yrinic acid a,c-diamide adenosyltransferase [Desulfomonilaceae bacterium]|nr:cob(I)yrinic acid a,c-diamide adenosyltransferase [Desulfomonilaceae bacterium]
MPEKRRIFVYTGDGKGKTTAALGRGLGPISRGLKVYMVQFLKRPNTSGEHFVPAALSSLFTIKPMGRGRFIANRPSEPEDRVMGQLALKQARNAMLSGEYATVILDEATAAVRKKVIDLPQLLDFMASKPEGVELVITGRHAPSDIIRVADVVIEMKKIRHHFDKGCKARKGIDY